MDIKTYISSGVLENYVLGLLSEQEHNEVVQMQERYPEVKAYVLSLENTLEAYGRLHAVTPPPALKDSIMEGIREQKASKEKKAQLDEAKLEKLHAQNNSTQLWRRMAIAACIILLCSLGLNVFLGSENRENEEQYQQLAADHQQLVADSATIYDRLARTEQKLQILSNPDLLPVVMKGVAQHPDVNATVYWNKTDRTVYLGKSELPALPAGKIYQLWAIVDGKPVDLGLYTPKSKDNLPQKMKSIQSGQLQAFAITMEKEGGNPTPTMDQMFVMGAAS